MTQNNKTKIIIAIIVIIVVVAGAYLYKADKKENISLVGCYVAHLAQDVYTLTIQSHQATNVRGTLSYKNFEKDSSAGTFEGTFTNNVLLGDYSFSSEGMDSVSQTIFKKEGDKFYQGFGPIQPTDNRVTFVNPSDVEYNYEWPFVKGECGQ